VSGQTSPPAPVREQDLHALVDEQLDAQRRAEVEAWLADNPAEAARVAEWRTHRDILRTLLDPILDEPLPQRLIDVGKGASWLAAWKLPAAAIAILVLGLAGGWLARGLLESPSDRAMAQLPERAATAYRVFAVEVRHPVEVAASDQDHLVTWLTRRMGHRVSAPDLRAQGYTLVGGRLLAGRTGPACQLMYEDRSGKRITAYIAENPANEQTAFRFREEKGVATFYWLDGPLGYALSGELRREELLAIAEQVYQQLRF